MLDPGIPKNLVLLDDDYVIRFVIKQILLHYFSPEQLKIFTSADGVTGLGYIFITKPEIIIVDTTLPKYGGLEIIEYIKTNQTLNSNGTKIIVILHDGNSITNLPKGYLALDKSDKDFLNNLVREIDKLVNNKRVNGHDSLRCRVMKHFGRKALKNADKSNGIAIKADNSRNIFSRSLLRLKWVVYQFITSTYLTFFYLFVGRKDKDLNIQQKKKDLWNSRIRAYPGVAVILAATFLFIFQIILISGTLLGVFNFAKNVTLAASYTWDGGGADNNWSTCANWTTDTCPVAGDTVTFDATSTKNSTVDAGYAAGAITIININAGYTGTLSLQRSLTISSTFTQSAGFFNAGSQTLTINSTFTMNAGSDFTASSGTMSVGGNFIINGGTFNHNSGTVTVTGAGSTTWTCNSITFNLVTFNNSGTKTISNGCNFPLGSSPTLAGAGSITVNGALSGSGTLTKVSGTLQFNATSSFTGFSGANVGGFTVAGATMNLSAYTTFIANSVVVSSGSLSLPSGSDINSSGLTITGGTFTAPSGTLTLATGLSISGAPTFNHNNGTITFDGSTATLSCNSVTFNLITFNNSGTKTVNSNCSLPLGNNPTLAGAGSIIVNGTLSGTGTITKGSATLNIGSGGTLSGFTGLNLSGFTVDVGASIDLSSYTSFTTSAQVNVNSGTLTLPNGADLNGTLTITNGTFNAPSGVMTIASSVTISGTPTFNHNNGTINFDGTTGGTLNCSSVAVAFNNIIFSHTTNTKTISGGCSFPLGNNPSVTGPLTMNDGTLSGTGTISFTSSILATTLNTGANFSGFTGLVVANSLVIGGATINLGSYTTVDLNFSTSFTLNSGTFTAPSGVMTVAGHFTINGGTFTHNNGTVTFDTNNTITISCNNAIFNLVTFAHNSATKTVSSNCSLPLGSGPTIPGPVSLSGILSGSGTLNSTSNLTLNTGGTISGFTGFNHTAGTLTVNGATADFSAYSPMNIFALTLSLGILTLPNSDINNALTISGGTFNAPSGTITVEGNLTVSGTPTFNHNGGTVTFDGSTTATLTCNNITFNLVTFNHFAPKTVNNGCNLPLGNNPSLGFAEVDLAGTLTGTGTLTQVSGNLRTESTAVLSGFSALALDNLFIEGTTLDLSSYTAVSTSRAFDLSQGGTFTGPTAVGMSVGHGLNIADGTFNQASGGPTTVGRYFAMTSSPTAIFNGSNQDLDISEDFQITSGTFNAPSGTIYLGGDGYVFEVNGGTFNHNNGTVVFDGTNQIIIGTTFFNFTKIVTSPDTLTFPAGGTETILGTATIKGTAGNLLSLRSSTPGVQWNIDPQGTRDIAYVDVEDGNNINASAIQLNGTGVNSGNNTNWNFNTPVVSNLGPVEVTSGGFINDSTPTVTFDVSDLDPGDAIMYRVQIDNNSDFLTPEVDQTSALSAQGSFSYTVPVPLADGGYYLRVGATDQTNPPFVYTQANGSSIAFIIDLTGPTGSIEIVDDAGSSNSYQVILNISASDSGTGVNEMMIAGSNTFTGASWEPYSTTKTYILPAGEGTKTVYIRFRDSIGNESITYTDTYTITLISVVEDTVPEPVLETIIPGIVGNNSLLVGIESSNISTEQFVDQISLYRLLLLIVDNNDVPLENVELTLGNREIETGDDGYALFTGLNRGEYNLNIAYDGAVASQILGIDGESSQIQIKIVLENVEKNNALTTESLVFLFVEIGLTLITIGITNGKLLEPIQRAGVFVGIVRKRKRKYWGIIFDKGDLTELAYAQIRLLQKELELKVIDSTVSDEFGRYGFAEGLTNGKYILEIAAAGYMPIQKDINLTNQSEIINDIALERVNAHGSLFASITRTIKYSKVKIVKITAFISTIVSLIGFIYTLLLLLDQQILLNVLFMFGYITLFILNILQLVKFIRRNVGKVVDAEDKGIQGAFVRIYMDDVQREVMITNIAGAIKTRIGKGSYIIRVDKEGYRTTQEQIQIQDNGYMDKDIVLNRA